MRRALLLILIASALGTGGAARASCTDQNRGGSVGPYDTAGVVHQNLEIKAWTYGNFATGPISVCSDGTTHQGSAYGYFEVRRDGVTVCSNTNPAFRITSDPFGFGATINGTGMDCAVRISFDGITAIPGASADDVAADAAGANAGIRKNAVVKNFGEGGTSPSTVTIGNETIVIPNGTLGYFTKGARAQSEH